MTITCSGNGVRTSLSSRKDILMVVAENGNAAAEPASPYRARRNSADIQMFIMDGLLEIKKCIRMVIHIMLEYDQRSFQRSPA